MLHLSGPAPWLLAWLTGSALQLFQPVLWSLTAYVPLAAVGFLSGWLWLWTSHRRPVKYVHSTVCAALCAGICLSFALTGMRAVWFSKDALDPALEGVDLQVTGVVSTMPQWHRDGVRFGFQVEQAERIDNYQIVEIPNALQTGWYTSNFDGEPRALPDIKAGDRWQLPLRLKRPHGLVNPGGFDAELWLWEQGVHATAHVRESAGALRLKRLQSTWQYPIEQLRQHTRTSIVQTLKDPRFSGQTAALLLGDQAAISQRDWDVFRLTGIAHLMSISGLHITLWAWVARWLISRIWRYSDIWGRSWCLPVLQTMDEHIDALVLSHQDSDHTGGALSVYKQHKQTQLWSSITDAHWLSKRLPMQRCEAGQTWVWDGVQFDFIHPLATDYDKTMSPNNRSCVLRIRAQSQTVLLTADIEAMQENALVQRMGSELKADVLLVPHHGSKTSSTESFLDAVQPRWALLQHGYRNRYGHPAPVVVQRYEVRGIRMLDSPHCGAMHWRSDHPEEVVCQRDLDKRYWRFGGR